MKLRFKPGTGSAMPYGFGTGAKTGEIVLEDTFGGPHRSLADVIAEVDRLRKNLDDILNEAKRHFGS